MAVSLGEWIESEVRPVYDKPLSWLSETYFFRDPGRPCHADPAYFFSPADGVILYQERAHPRDGLFDIKGRGYSLCDALGDPSYDKPSLVIGIFMTFFDVHVNRVPYSGRLSYRRLEPLATHNHPMLEMEENLLRDLRIDLWSAEYLRHNQRMVNHVYVSELGQEYYILQVADYDVDKITPFELRQNWPARQGARFSQIRYGSQVDLIIPLSDRFEFEPTQPVGHHVQAAVDTLVRISDK
ncbi:phosphatidylserine decarboxylase [Streptosporangium sp. NPDC006007]|uniref:phosphatidylserine decarboxylase n=1 Tax=Streptosporangium sp. NPDC006007 TaxID=3154575 RepID=UPI0033B2EC91